MKKLILGILAAAMLTVPVFAHPPISVFVDDASLSFDQPPIIQDDRTLVPMRGIFQAMGAEVSWDEPAQMITAVYGEDTIVFRVGMQELYKNGEEIVLSSKENAIIKLFMDHVNRIFPKEMIYSMVWGDAIVDENTVMVYINRLRQKIEDDPANPKFIQTVRGLGYRFVV